MDKIKSAEAFLRSLENPNTTMNLMMDRIDEQMLCIINNYSELIAKVKEKSGLDQKDLVSCSIIIGFLLRSELTRIDMEESLKGEI